MPLILSGSAGLSGNVGTTTKEMMYGGSVLQVVSMSTTTGTSNSSTSTYADTTLQAAITPLSNTSKILVLANSNYYVARNGVNTGYGDILVRVLRNGSVDIGTKRFAINQGTNTSWGDFFGDYSLIALDSPASSSQVTYKVQIKPQDYSYSTNMPFQGIGELTLMEIKA